MAKPTQNSLRDWTEDLLSEKRIREGGVLRPEPIRQVWQKHLNGEKWAPYEMTAELLPKTLEEALAALRADDLFAASFGKDFVDYYLRIKEAEITRYQSEVSDWEQKEYFELF